MTTALITGITGQDGSYLAEFLLERGYEVVGLVRRTSTVSFERIAHIQDRLRLVPGDLLDEHSLIAALREYRPSEVYNLAAQSFVQTSWNQPVFTGEVTALGVTRLLDAIRTVDPAIRFYQASSSEMFGKVQQVPQTEATPFYPRSPYGVAKVYGHWITVNYRESYGIYAASGILFNHECVAESTPLLVRRGGAIDVARPVDLVPLRRKGPSTQQFEPPTVEVWDGDNWAAVTAITATRRRATDPDHEMLLIQSRAGSVATTAHHTMFGVREEQGTVAAEWAPANGAYSTDSGAWARVPASSIRVGDAVRLADHMPAPPGWTALTIEMAELLGLLAADGYVGDGSIQFTNNDAGLRSRVADLWRRSTMGSSREDVGRSGWNPDRAVHQLYLSGATPMRRYMRDQLYTEDGFKKVPAIVLNAPADVQAAFLEGYYAGDGLKRGNGLSVKSNSGVLALGVTWLYAVQGRQTSVYTEQRGDRSYYQLNIQGTPPGDKGRHLRRAPDEVRSIDPYTGSNEWVFDLETASGRFMAGVGRVVVCNSPRRGLEFVTRKISDGVARIHLGMASELSLGNLDSRRDWGWAPDYVRAMWLMLQQSEPEDFVIATGETHSVEEFCDVAFSQVGRDWRDHVTIDQRFLRPAEVDLLVGDPTKARATLGWEPTVGFQDLVRSMVDADIARLSAAAGSQ